MAQPRIEEQLTAPIQVQAPRRFPVKLPRPNSVLIMTLVLLAIAMLALTVISNRGASPFTGVKGQVETDLVVSRAPGPEPQTAPVAAVAKEWPKVEVQWSEPFLINSLADLPPSLPAGKGFYRETPEGIGSAGSSDEAFVFAQKILGISTPSNITPVIAGIARDPTNPNVVFAGISVSHKDPGQIRFFLSIDGEKTWNEVSIIYPDRPLTGGSFDVRVERKGDSMILYARDPDFVAPMWRKATLSLKGLPQ